MDIEWPQQLPHPGATTPASPRSLISKQLCDLPATPLSLFFAS